MSDIFPNTIKVCFKPFVTLTIKFHNFSNIWSSSTVQIVLESFGKGNMNINRKFRHEISVVPKVMQKMNFSSKRRTTLKISDMKP